MNSENLRISKLRAYLIGIIDTLSNDTNYQLNADMLSNDVNDYSMNKISTDSEVEKWIIGSSIKKDVYSLRSRREYSQDTITNLLNIGFFEKFEEIIETNNDKGILPDIENIESIKCLNCGAMALNDNGNSAVFDIQIQITYRNTQDNTISL